MVKTNMKHQYQSLLEVPAPWPKVNPRIFNAKLVEKRLQQLAQAGIYFDDRVIN